MLEIEQVIDALDDGEWHELDEIGKKCEVSQVKIKRIVRGLAEYGFIEIKGKGRRLKVGPSLQKFLDETQTLEIEA